MTVGHGVALLGVVLVTAIISAFSADARIGNVSILYVPVVLVTAVRFGRGPAILASIAAFLLYDWFFVEPRYHLAVAGPNELLSLLLLLGTAAVTGQLAADQRARARDATEREREAVVLHDLARLMGEPHLQGALDMVAERLRRELALSGVAIDVHDASGSIHRSTAGDADAARVLGATPVEEVLRHGPAPTAASRGGPGRWVRIISPYRGHAAIESAGRLSAVPIASADRRVGALLLLRRPGQPRFSRSEDRLLAAAAAQIGLAVERARLRREAAEGEVLRRTDDLKSALLNAVSHDLRTPLASITASVTSLRQRDVTWSDAEREEFLASIEEEARRLDRLVGNLLDLSRIEAGTLRPQKAWYDAGALVDDVVGRLRGVTAAHAVSVHVPEDLPPVSLDYVEIDQVLSNLIENAARYSPPGSGIEIAIRADDGAARFEVRDHGPGVRPEDERELFVPFARVGRGDRDRRGGLGLGLAVARRLVEAHGGRIWLERPEGGGARFVFALPMGDGSSG